MRDVQVKARHVAKSGAVAPALNFYVPGGCLKAGDHSPARSQIMRPIAACWILCSFAVLVLLVGVHVLADRLVVASKLEEVGVWALYVGVVLSGITQVMLTPVTASRLAGLPEWLDLALGLLTVAVLGAVCVVAVGRVRARFRAKVTNPGSGASAKPRPPPVDLS